MTYILIADFNLILVTVSDSATINSTEALQNMTMEQVNITQLVLNSTENMECDSARRYANNICFLAPRPECKVTQIIRK